MAKESKEKKGTISNIFIILFLITSLITSGALVYGIFLYEGIESLIRYIIMGLIVANDIRLIFKTRRMIKGKARKNKKPKKKLFIFTLLIYSIVCGFIGYYTLDIYGKINGVNKTTVTYTSYLITMNSNTAKDMNDVSDMKLGILSDKKSPDGYIIPQEMIKENNLQDDNEIVSYDDYTSMIVDLYAGEIDGSFITSNYVSMFSGITGYENIENDTKIIAKKSKSMKKSSTSKVETASTGKSITEPFTILLMGIDSTDEVLTKNAIANGDTLILITFNPKTLNATMLSIPRDSYVPIACWSGKPENKITHAAAYGNDCMINTIECIHEGHQTLNGEQALVFARNRKQLADGDFGRAKHQQEIIMALVNKMKDINDLKTFMSILDTVSNSLDTNLTTKQILSFYDVGKDIIKKSLSSNEADLVNIQQLFLQGSGQMIYDERARMVLWDYVPNTSSKKDIIQAMKVNLELEEHEDIKEFHFSINEPYEKKVIGEGPYSNTGTYRLLPDFTGDTEAQARATASRLGISVTFDGTSGTVVAQSEPANKRIDLMRGGLRLTLSGNKKVDTKIIDDKSDKKNTTGGNIEDKTKPTTDDNNNNTGKDDDNDTGGGNSNNNTPNDNNDNEKE